MPQALAAFTRANEDCSVDTWRQTGPDASQTGYTFPLAIFQKGLRTCTPVSLIFSENTLGEFSTVYRHLPTPPSNVMNIHSASVSRRQ